MLGVDNQQDCPYSNAYTICIHVCRLQYEAEFTLKIRKDKKTKFFQLSLTSLSDINFLIANFKFIRKSSTVTYPLSDYWTFTYRY